MTDPIDWNSPELSLDEPALDEPTPPAPPSPGKLWGMLCRAMVAAGQHNGAREAGATVLLPASRNHWRT